MNKKRYFSKEEIDNFKEYMRINRSLPREYFLKMIDKWRCVCKRQEKFMKRYLVIFDRLLDDSADRSITSAMCRELAAQIREELSKETI